MYNDDKSDSLLKIISENNFKRYKNKENVHSVMIEFVNIESSSIVKSYFSNLPKSNEAEILEYIPPQAANRRATYEKYAYMIRTENNKMTRIKIGKYDYILCAKEKGDKRPWSNVIPYIEPGHLPLFNVGLLDDETNDKIKGDEKNRRENKIRIMNELLEQ